MVKTVLKVVQKMLRSAILDIVRKTFRSYLYNISNYDNVITVCFTNKGASKKLLVELNTNTVFSFANRFCLTYVIILKN